MSFIQTHCIYKPNNFHIARSPLFCALKIKYGEFVGVVRDRPRVSKQGACANNHRGKLNTGFHMFLREPSTRSYIRTRSIVRKGHMESACFKSSWLSVRALCKSNLLLNWIIIDIICQYWRFLLQRNMALKIVHNMNESIYESNLVVQNEYKNVHNKYYGLIRIQSHL